MHIDPRRATTMVRKSEALAALAVLAGLMVGVFCFLAVRSAIGGSHPRAQRAATERRKSAPARVLAARHTSSVPSRRSEIGAVRAATGALAALAAAGVGTAARAREIVAATTTGSLQAKLERSLPAVASAVQARLRGSRTAGVFDGWPLGYRVESFDPSRATVAVWHLDVAASSSIGLVTAQYTTTTYELRWIQGSWRIDAVSSVSGPTPPPASAPTAEVDEFAREASALSRYAYVP